MSQCTWWAISEFGYTFHFMCLLSHSFAIKILRCNAKFGNRRITFGVHTMRYHTHTHISFSLFRCCHYKKLTQVENTWCTGFQFILHFSLSLCSLRLHHIAVYIPISYLHHDINICCCCCSYRKWEAIRQCAWNIAYRLCVIAAFSSGFFH